MGIRNYLASYINKNNMYVILLWRPVHYLATNYQLPITNYKLPITNYQLQFTNYQLPITCTNYQFRNFPLIP